MYNQIYKFKNLIWPAESEAHLSELNQIVNISIFGHILSYFLNYHIISGI